MRALSGKTQKNWWVDALLFVSGLAAILSGIYFLAFPEGGYRGGRNPYYDLQILFSRHTWEDVHTWTGIAMIVAALIHLIIHLRWVTGMVRRTWNEFAGRCGCLNPRGRWNLVLNSFMAFSFLLTAFSGVYFLFVPGGKWAVDPMFIVSRTTWDLIHTWAGITFIATAIIHFAIHWRWIINVTRKMFTFGIPSTQTQPEIETVNS